VRKMTKVVEDYVDISNIDAETCKRLYGGKVLPGNKCRVRIEIDDTDPKHASIIPIKDENKRLD